MSKIVVGQQFPDLAIDTLYGGKKHISDLLCEKKTVLWCLRYIGCTVCRYDVHVLSKRYEEVLAKGAQVCFMMQSEKEILLQELQGETLPFDIICDPSMELYKALDIQPAESMEALLGDGLAKLQEKGAAAAAAGFSHGKYEGDEQQLPAMFVLDANGTVEMAHYAASIMDMPTLDELLEIL